MATVIFLLPFVDEIVGRIYLNYLCHSKAGFEVYQAVKLPGEYWDENGNPKFFNNNGYLKHNFWIANLQESSQVNSYSTIFPIDERIANINYRPTGERLGKVVTYKYGGGWINRNLSVSAKSSSCRFVRDKDFSMNFYGRLFIPKDK